MGHVFRRSSGRGWRLRQRSMALWPQWIRELQQFEPALSLDRSLIQVAEDASAFERMRKLASDRSHLGLRAIPPSNVGTIWPTAQFGALHSENDGRIDPMLLQRALRFALAERDVELVPEPVDVLTRKNPDWQLNCSGGHRSVHDAVVICAALASPALIEPLGHSRPISPVLGQALSLHCADGPSSWQGWPAVLVDQGFNLIPNGPNRLLLGATVEPGDSASPSPLELMRSLNDRAPTWLKNAEPIEQWSGLRARPVDRPAPLLETLEPGLILASGHYRNGVLLAPATAEWISNGFATSANGFAQSK